LPTILSDNRGGGSAAARHLLELGHRRFGYLMPPPRNLDAPDRLAGVRDALTAAGLNADELRPDGALSALAIGHGAPTVTGGEAAMAGLLELRTRPTGVIAYNDLMAIGAMRAVRSSGLRVPDDVSLIGFDDVAFAAYVEPPLTTLRQETAEMGRWAVATLTERVRATSGDGDSGDVGRRGERDPATAAATQRIVPVLLVVRSSTAPPPAG
jgi:DNA-binding LacI/PurR family transcriptional regulator